MKKTRELGNEYGTITLEDYSYTERASESCIAIRSFKGGVHGLVYLPVSAFEWFAKSLTEFHLRAKRQATECRNTKIKIAEALISRLKNLAYEDGEVAIENEDKQYGDGKIGREEAEYVIGADDQRVFYGPFPCEKCGTMIVTLAMDRSGTSPKRGAAYKQPEGPIYPNSVWREHDDCGGYGQVPPAEDREGV